MHPPLNPPQRRITPSAPIRPTSSAGTLIVHLRTTRGFTAWTYHENIVSTWFQQIARVLIRPEPASKVRLLQDQRHPVMDASQRRIRGNRDRCERAFPSTAIGIFPALPNRGDRHGLAVGPLDRETFSARVLLKIGIDRHQAASFAV